MLIIKSNAFTEKCVKKSDDKVHNIKNDSENESKRTCKFEQQTKLVHDNINIHSHDSLEEITVWQK